MGKRPRINQTDIGIQVIDELAYIKNKGSDFARKVFSNSEIIEFDIWFDKHYFIREQHGDDNGKREGIDKNAVQNLITLAAKHLLYYSIKIKGFGFVNFNFENRAERLALALLEEDKEPLNVIAEYHYLNLNKYEVTVKTAIRKQNFHFSDGQYQVEISQEGSSRLFKKERGKINLISNYTNE